MRRSLGWLLAASLPAGVIASVIFGSTDLDAGSVLAALTTLAPGSGPDSPDQATLVAIVFELRLPRALLAAMVGAILAMVGVMLQTVTRNDLADPFLFGLSSGAAVGAVAVIVLTGEALGIWSVPLAAFGGAMVAAGCVQLLMRRAAEQGAERLVLAGVAVSFLFGALTHLIIVAGDQRSAQSALFWTLGGLGTARWDNLAVAVAGLTALIAFALRRRRRLDALLAGDDTAHSLGVQPERLRAQTFMVCAFATACCVALAGVIGFVGLMVPHLARRHAGVLHAGLLPWAALLGALLMLGCDLAARTLLAPQELPVGIVTAIVGAGFVLAVLGRDPHRN